MSEINSRILQVCESRFGGMITEMAKKCDIPPTTMRLLTGRDIRGDKQQEPKYEQIVKIYRNSNISLRWLLLGEGELSDPRPLNELMDTTEIIYKKAGTSNNSEATAQDTTKIKELNDQIAQLQHNIELLIEQNSRIVQINQQLTDRLLNSQFPSISTISPEGQSVPNT